MFLISSKTRFAIASVVLFFLGFPGVKGQFSLVGSATNLGGNCYQLTDGANLNEKGAIWNNTQINLSNGFDFTFHVNIIEGSGVGFSADGLAFVLQSTGVGAISALAGNTLGYANTTTGPPCPGGPHVGGINPSLAVELDIFDNIQANTCILENANDHIAIVRNGDFTAPISGPVCAFAACATNVEVVQGSNACRTFRIVYTPSASNQLQVYYNGALRINTNYNIIANVFGGNPNVYFGMTGSTGGLSATQIVCWEFANAGQDTTICSGSALQLGASGGTTYAWTPATWVSPANTSNPAFTQTTAGTYPLTVNVTNVYGCQDTNIVNVVVESNPVPGLNPDRTICAGDSTQIGPPQNNNYTYSWSPITGLSNPNIARPMASPANTTVYTVTITDTTTNALCTATDQVTVTVNPEPVAVTGNDTTICEGGCASLGAPAQPNFVYAWSPAATLSSGTAADPSACPTTTTTYQLILTNTNTGCDDTSSVTVTVNPTPVADAGPDTSVCLGQSVTLQGDSTGGNSVLWSPAGTLSSATDITPIATPIATTNYVLTLTDLSTGCFDTDTVTVTINTPDPVNITTADTFICNVDTVQINSTSGPGINQWVWTPGAGLSSSTDPNPLAFPTGTTTYFLTGTNTSTGCQAVDSITISVFALDLGGLADTAICRGDTVQFDVIPSQGSGNYQFTWISTTGEWISDSTLGDPFVAPQANTQFIVTVLDLTSGCSDQGIVNVTVSQLAASVTPTLEEINPGQFVQLTAGGGNFYTWSPTTGLSCTDCYNPIASPPATTTYIVTVSDSTGCTGTATTTIVVDSMIAQNVFTPNDDGINDLLFFNYLGTGEYQVYVFDRWGTLVFSTNNPSQGWNGKTASGADAPEGVYYVLVKIADDDAIPDTHKNRAWDVTLLR